MAEIFEVNGENILVPIGPPERLLPPDVEVKTSLDKIFNLIKDQDLSQDAKIVNERPGRYMWIIDYQEEADQVDPYRFMRKFIPGGKLPWEA